MREHTRGVGYETSLMALVGAVAVTVSLFCCAEQPDSPPKPGQRPTDTIQLEQVNAARQKLALALGKEDAAAITAAETKLAIDGDKGKVTGV